MLQVRNVKLLSGGVHYNNSLGHSLSRGFSYQGESTNCCGNMFLEHVQILFELLNILPSNDLLYLLYQY